MSDTLTNQEILAFITKNFGSLSYTKYGNEIDILFNNLITTNCSFPYNKLTYYTIIGSPNNINDITSYAYMIPNLFRKCFINNTVNVPSICPAFIYMNYNIYFFPLLIDPDLIKSFLYFGFTTNILKYNPGNIKDYIETGLKYRLAYINNIARNTTYDSSTIASIIFNSIYPKDSLIQQLVAFNKIILTAEYASGESNVINSYIIPWNYVTACVCASGIVQNTDILSNNGVPLGLTTLNNMFTLLYSKLFDSNLVLRNTGIPNKKILRNSIFYILEIVNQVYEDILIKIQFYTTQKYYCEKEYMSITKLPQLYELYTNYYNNQVYVNSQQNVAIL